MTLPDLTPSYPIAEPMPSKQDILSWAETNLDLIIAAQEEVRKADSLKDNAQYGETSPSYLSQYRCLGEMPVCTAIGYLDLPPSFAVIPADIGVVYSYGSHTGLPLLTDPHSYALGPNDLILCLNPGYFIDRYATLFYGQRLQKLQQKAPDLITLFSNPDNQYHPIEVGVLFGTKDQIFRQLGLYYTIVNSPPPARLHKLASVQNPHTPPSPPFEFPATAFPFHQSPAA